MGKLGLVLDCDGTLMDTIGAWHEAELMLLEEVGAKITKEERDHLNALTLEEAAAFFHERFGVRADAESVQRAVLDHLLDFYQTKSRPTQGALDFVKAARGEGAAIAVLSSSPQQFLQAGMARGGFAPYLDRVVSVEDLATTKRDPQTYLHMCDLLGTEPEDTWLVDDSWYAVETARRAGLHAVGVYSSDNCGTHEELSRYCDKVVDTFLELSPTDLK